LEKSEKKWLVSELPYIVKLNQFRDRKSGTYFFLFRISVEGSLTLLSYASALNLKFEKVIHGDKVVLCSDWFGSLKQAEEKMGEIISYLRSKGEKMLVEDDIFEEFADF